MTEQEEKIFQALQSLLRDYSTQPTPSTTFTSITGVVQHLESKLGFDLSHKTDFIQAQIQQLLLQRPPPPPPPPPRPLPQPLQKDHLALQQNSNLYSSPPPAIYPILQPVVLVKQENVAATAAVSSPKEGASGKGKRKGGAGGLNKLCSVSAELQAIVGHPPLPRTEIVRQLWAYIRKNNLQDPSNKRKIICNDELRLVFETDCTDIFKMNKLLAKHIIPLEPTKQKGGTKKHKVDEECTIRHSVSGPSVQISEALANFFGVGTRKMLQSEVFTRLWQYININSLEDPLNPMVILCDAKLQDLFGCQSLPASRIPEVLAQHHIFRTS